MDTGGQLGQHARMASNRLDASAAAPSAHTLDRMSAQSEPSREPARPSEPVAPADPTQLRIYDAERHQVADLLREAAGDGRLTMEELDERLEVVYKSKTYAELVPVTVDLPGARDVLPQAPAGATAPAASSGATVRPGSSHSDSGSVAIFGGATRKGQWTVAAQYTALAVFGGVELDFREATFTAHETELYANCLFGGIDITVPDDVAVRVSGVPIFGGYEHGKGESADLPANAPVLHVKGVALFGGVDVKRKPRKKPKSKD